MPLPIGVYRADHVGSLLRPKEIHEGRAKLTSLDTSPLRSIEDKCIADVVAQELNAGLRSITDGEFRRAFFHMDFLQQLDGVKVDGMITANNKARNYALPEIFITDKVRHSKPIQLEDFRFLQRQVAKYERERASDGDIKATIKVCIPSPSMCHFRGSREAISLTAYPTLEPFFDDLAKAYQAEIQTLYDSGCRFIQLDDTNLARLCDHSMRADAEKRHGMAADAITSQYVQLINTALSKKPDDLVTGIHLCRGNYRSQWFAKGGYDPVAEILFRDLNVDVYFLEYDDERSGDFSPLKHIPEHKKVVLGVLGSKTGKLADKENVKKRIYEAAKFIPGGLDQLCLSHQCGFSGSVEGNILTEEEQWAKIRQQVEIAKEVWGPDLSN